MFNIMAIPIIHYSKISIIVFPASYTLQMNLFPTSYPVTGNEFDHTAMFRYGRGAKVNKICQKQLSSYRTYTTQINYKRRQCIMFAK